MPLCRPLGGGLWEVRTVLPSKTIARMMFCNRDSRILVLRGFIKKGRKTPAADLALAHRRMKEFGGGEGRPMKRKKRPMTRRSAAELGSLDEFLKEQGKLDAFEAVAVKEVLAWQIAEAMREANLSRKRMAERMRTSRSQVARLLDPTDGNVTLATLQRAATIVGRKLRLELA
jgi:hypothetical protein